MSNRKHYIQCSQLQHMPWENTTVCKILNLHSNLFLWVLLLANLMLSAKIAKFNTHLNSDIKVVVT